MPDMEKVIAELQEFHDREWTDERMLGLPAQIERKRITGNALAMLKEQDSTINELQNAYGYLQKQFFDAQDKLLKEQEAVKPEQEHSSSGVTWWNVCGACKTAINPNDKYCHECGRAVKWE